MWPVSVLAFVVVCCSINLNPYAWWSVGKLKAWLTWTGSVQFCSMDFNPNAWATHVLSLVGWNACLTWTGSVHISLRFRGVLGLFCGYDPQSSCWLIWTCSVHFFFMNFNPDAWAPDVALLVGYICNGWSEQVVQLCSVRLAALILLLFSLGYLHSLESGYQEDKW